MTLKIYEIFTNILLDDEKFVVTEVVDAIVILSELQEIFLIFAGVSYLSKH